MGEKSKQKIKKIQFQLNDDKIQFFSSFKLVKTGKEKDCFQEIGYLFEN